MSRILIVEDNPAQARRLALILEAAGFEVETAPGIERLAQRPFDLVLEDAVHLNERSRATREAMREMNAQLVSAFRELEERNGQLQQLTEELAASALSVLRAQNEELEQANAELRQANQLREAFIRVASHELRTPLTIVLGLTGLALAPGPGVETSPLLFKIQKAAERLGRRVDHLTQLLRAGRFERPLERRPIDLEALVRQAAEDVQPFVEQRRQKLAVVPAPDLQPIHGDASMLRDSLEHLLFNAIKFTPDGGEIRLTVRQTAEGQTEIQVRDTGIGIDAAALPHVFEPFFTAFDVSRHSSGQFEFGRRGLGLGLSLVKAFVEMHGGTVEAASEPGRGSTFTVTLPPGA